LLGFSASYLSETLVYTAIKPFQEFCCLFIDIIIIFKDFRHFVCVTCFFLVFGQTLFIAEIENFNFFLFGFIYIQVHFCQHKIMIRERLVVFRIIFCKFLSLSPFEPPLAGIMHITFFVILKH
jgi:hypothetical protein